MRDAARYDHEMLSVLSENFAPKMRRAFTEAVSNSTNIERDILRETVHDLIGFVVGIMDNHVGLDAEFSTWDLADRLTAAYANLIQSGQAQEYLSATLPPLSTQDKIQRLKDVRYLDIPNAVRLEKYRQRLLLDQVPGPIVQREVAKLRDQMIQIRGNLLATTETTRVVNAAVMQLAWNNASILDPKVEWVARKDRRTEKECLALDGERISVGDTFFLLSGRPIEHPPAHPGCRCFLSIAWT